MLARKIQAIADDYAMMHVSADVLEKQITALIESEKHDFLTKVIGHVNTRISCNMLHPICEKAKACVKELDGMRVYLKRQRGDKDEPPPSAL